LQVLILTSDVTYESHYYKLFSVITFCMNIVKLYYYFLFIDSVVFCVFSLTQACFPFNE